MRVLITGMAGTGKSTVVAELRRRGHIAYDADDHGFSEPRPDGRWGWRLDAVRALFAEHPDDVLFFAGCSEEQRELDFDVRVLLSVPEQVLVQRLRTRTTNDFGRTDPELALVLHDLREVEPLLRTSADLVIDATLPVTEVAGVVERAAPRAQP
jgi:hypothetical protein